MCACVCVCVCVSVQTLKEAIRDEVFFHVREIVARAPGEYGPRVHSSRGPPKLKMLYVLLTLLDIARALRHLHRHQVGIRLPTQIDR